MKINSWREDETLKNITEKSKDRIETFFKVEKDRAVTLGYVFRKLLIDQRTVARILDAMVKEGVLERIETTSWVNYRATDKLFKKAHSRRRSTFRSRRERQALRAGKANPKYRKRKTTKPIV